MASAFKDTRYIPATVEEDVYVLELSGVEADTLLLITDRIGGSPGGSRRGDVDNIRKALGGLRELLDPVAEARTGFQTGHSAALYFREYDREADAHA